MGEGAGVWIPAFNGKGGHLGMMSPTEILNRDPKLSSLLEEVVTRSIPKYVAVTFDDGTAITQYNNIKQIISKYEIPVTLFVETNPSGARIRSTYNEPAIAEPEHQYKIRELHETGLVEIGSHTHTHPYLTNLSEEEIKTEMETSKAILEGIINAPVTSLAYPFGAFNDTVLRIVKKYYSCARGIRIYAFNEVPIRPSSRYKIATVLIGTERVSPFIPVVSYYHNDPLSTIESDILPCIRGEAVFLKFSEFVEKVTRLPRLGIKVTFTASFTNATSARDLYLGTFPGEVECSIIASDPSTAVEIYYGLLPSRELGGFHITPSTFSMAPSLSDIYNLGGTDIWEVHKWNPSENIYIIRTRRPLRGESGLWFRVVPPSGSAVSAKFLVTYEI